MAQPPSSLPGAAAEPGQEITFADYRNVGLLFAAFAGSLVYFGRFGGESTRPNLVLGPVIAMASVVAVVWVLMVIFRNLATLRGETPSAYYVTYSGPTPADWIERPARAFNNLMQLPTLFYVVCVLMLVTAHFDRAQLAYAWIFVALRALHALVYIGWNVVAYRFATWVMSSITLLVLWLRFALEAWPGFCFAG